VAMIYSLQKYSVGYFPLSDAYLVHTGIKSKVIPLCIEGLNKDVSINPFYGCYGTSVYSGHNHAI
jgi:hypothetical protein